MSEILQSVSLLDDSGLANGCNSRLSGQNTSKSSRGAFNLKVESSRNGVLGQAGGGEVWQSFFASRMLVCRSGKLLAGGSFRIGAVCVTSKNGNLIPRKIQMNRLGN